MARPPPQLPAHMPCVSQGVSRLQSGRHGSGARAHGHRCAPAATVNSERARRCLRSSISLRRQHQCAVQPLDVTADAQCSCAGHAGAGLCWNIAPKQPAHFDVIDVQWGFMKVDANATHIAMEVRHRHFILTSRLASSVQSKTTCRPHSPGTHPSRAATSRLTSPRNPPVRR